MSPITQSAWLRVWDEIDREWLRVEYLLLSILMLLLLGAGLLGFGHSMIASTPPALVEQSLEVLLLCLVLLSASVAVAGAGHSEPVDPGRLRLRQYGRVGLCLIPALACLLLATAGLRHLALDIQLGSTGPLGAPGWWQNLLFPLVFLVMALRLFRHSLRQLAPPP